MNSLLNPEAPEFYPHLTSVTQGGYTSMNKTIRSSNQMPSGVSYDLFKTFTDFNIVTCQLSENVVEQSNQIITNELPAVKLKRYDSVNNTEKIIDANDCMLDRVNVNIDTVSGVNKPSDGFLSGVKAGNVSSWNKATPVIAKIQVGSTMFIGAKNIPRPQLTFKDTIDNSESLWVPKISDKPNNIKPLALNILYNEKGEAVGYEHPYQVELDLYQPPAWALAAEAPPLPFPPPLEATPLTYIDTEAQLDALVRHLDQVTEIAVDLEHHSYRTYQGITCLIQITTSEGGDFVVDVLAVREHVHKLNQAFTDPNKLKVLHGAEMDVVWLQRDFGVYIVGMFDTHQAARALKVNGLSLKYLLMKYCGVNADKKFQLADWRMRPLPAELVRYARTDTHYLLYVWRALARELRAAAPPLLLAVFEQSRQICAATYNKTVVGESSHLALYVKSRKHFSARQLAALKMLYKWRDVQARALDESTMYLLPNHMLLALAEALPREVQGVNACCNPMPPFVKQNLITIHRMILSCRELPLEPTLTKMPPAALAMANLHQTVPNYHIHDLTQLPDFRDDSNIDLDRAAVFLAECWRLRPDVAAFEPTHTPRRASVVSHLNAEAKLFIPPYDRFRKYRSLAQIEELQQYKEKEAKITAIAKGNELIKTEVLMKIQEAKTQVEEEQVAAARPADTRERKRKMPADKAEHTPAHDAGAAPDTTKTTKNNKTETKKNTKQFNYSKANYRKFYDETEKAHVHKQPKMKFKKH